MPLRVLGASRLAPVVVSDMWNPRYETAWVSLALLALLVAKLFPTFLSSGSLYSQIIPNTYAAWSVGGHQYCLYTYMACDAAFFVSLLAIWRLHGIGEVSPYAWAVIVLGTLYHWHRGLAQGGIVLLLSRLLVTTTTVYLAGKAFLRRKGHPQGPCTAATAISITAATAGASARAVSIAEPPPQQTQDAAADPLPLHAEEHVCPVNVPDIALSHGESGGRSNAASSGAAGGVPGQPTLPLEQHLLAQPVAGGAAHRYTAAVAPCPHAPDPLAHLGHSSSPPPLPAYVGDYTPEGATALSSADLASVLSALQREPYRSPVGRCVVRLKIPWAEPEQLTPGYEARIAAVAAQHGMRVAGTYVRSGCIELVVVLEAVTQGQQQEQGQQEQGQEQEQQQPGLHAAAAAGMREAEEATHGGLHRWHLDPAAVVGALELRPGPEHDSQQKGDNRAAGAYTASPDASSLVAMQLAQVATSRYLLTPTAEAEAGLGSYGSRRGALPSVRLSPRVLLLRASSAADGPVTVLGSGGGPAGVPGTSCKPALETLQLRVKRPAVAVAGDMEVLVRAGNSYLPARVTTRRRSELLDCREPHVGLYDNSGAEKQQEEKQQEEEEEEEGYEVELLGLPERPGVVMLELCWRGLEPPFHSSASSSHRQTKQQQQELRHHQHPDERDTEQDHEQSPLEWRVTLPLLATGDADVAAEVSAGAERWPEDSYDELDELLYDMGTWAALSCRTDSQLHGYSGRDDSSSLSCDEQVWKVLGPHLLKHAEAAGWEATAARIRADLAGMREGQQRWPQSHAAAGFGAHPAGTPVTAAHSSNLVDSSTGNDGPRGSSCGSAGAGRGGGQSGSGGPVRPMGRAIWLSALLRVLGWEVVPAAEAAAFEEFTGAWSVAQGHTIQMVECLALPCMLFRATLAGNPPLGAANAVAVVGCGVGTLTTLAWLVLPYISWVRLVRAAKLPRYGGHLAAKALVAVGRLPAPPGIAAYGRGMGALLMEGLILPGACLMSPRAAALISLLKLPLNAAMLLVTGAAAAPAAAVLLAARVEALALLTTLAAHVYMRLAYLWRAEQGHLLQGGIGGSGGAEAGGTFLRGQMFARAAAKANLLKQD